VQHAVDLVCVVVLSWLSATNVLVLTPELQHLRKERSLIAMLHKSNQPRRTSILLALLKIRPVAKHIISRTNAP
jgi:hypothetical protein